MRTMMRLIGMALLAAVPVAAQAPSVGTQIADDAAAARPLEEGPQAPVPETVIAGYGAAWNEADPGRRAQLLQEVWADDGTYTDPRNHIEGRDALHAHIGTFLGTGQGARIELFGGLETHHDVARFRWRMVEADGTVAVTGTDFAEFDEDGRLARIIGFFDTRPEG